MAGTKPQLSLFEKVTFVFAILRALGVGLITLFTALFRGSGSAGYVTRVKIAVLRTLMKNTTVRQHQYIGADLDISYPAYAKKRGFTPRHVTLPDGTKAYWFGDPSAEKVLLWYHGGGFNTAPDPGHLTFVDSLTSPSLSALMLSYTLAPQATYPRQLHQAVSLLRHTITSLHHAPENIIIAGDSAGANVAVGVLSHILHPHPDIEPLTFDNGARLRAAILLAPWVSFHHDWPSFTSNAHKDIVSVALSDLWSQSFQGGKIQGDAYSEPMVAEQEWWIGLDSVVKECLIVGGGDEILLDQIRELGRRFRAVHEEGVTVVIAGGEWHDMPVLSTLGAGGEQSAAIRGFVKARV